MKKIVIVGSGASGVHFALSVLKKGHDVTMLDVGFNKPDIVNREDNINELKSNLKDPVDYFLGKKFEAFISPDYKGEYYGFPPSKSYVFTQPSRFRVSSTGFLPLFSFARGGLAESWTGGSYPLNDHELSDFPFSYNDLMPYYNEVARRIGISGEKDDLEVIYPFHDDIISPLPLDQHSSQLLSAFKIKREYYKKKYQLRMGRSRVATLSQEKEDRNACMKRCRCLWGCPDDALYTPSITLRQCMKYANFCYVPDILVTHFQYNDQMRISKIHASSVTDNKPHCFDLDFLVLAAGTLSSSKIFMESIHRKTGRIIKLNGLMDNRQVLLPFVNLRRIGKPVDFENYQYHQIAMGIQTENPKEYIHGQITTLKSALVHPIIKSIPLDLKTAIYIFKNLHSALGLINLNFHDYRRDSNYVSLKANKDQSEPTLEIVYVPDSEENIILNRTIKKIKKAFFKLSCIFPPGMIHVRPMGASVHYSGTIPMSDKNDAFTSSKFCKSHDFENLFMVDGSTFPFLPAKNLTFTLMANAIRVADNAF